MKFLIKLLTNILLYANKIFNFIEVSETELLKIVSVSYSQHMSAYKIRLENNPSLSGIEIFESIWETLNTIEEWKQMDKKIFMIAIYNSELDKKYYIQKNILVEKDTTFDKYFNSIKNIVDNYLNRYQTDLYDQFQIVVWPIVRDGKNHYKLGGKLINVKRLYHTLNPISKRSYHTEANKEVRG